MRAFRQKNNLTVILFFRNSLVILVNQTKSPLRRVTMSKGKKYAGKNISVFFERKKCIHSRNCVLGLPDVFQANAEGPWIKPDNSPAEELAAIIRSCPSGALTYERLDNGLQESAPHVNVIRILENGPLAVHADMRIEGRSPSSLFRATLCRCGASENKPYCDGNHKKIGFTATGEPKTTESYPLEVRNGPLHITPLENAPLLVSGNVEICSGTGRIVNRTQNIALCRCGASRNRPYCDGSHSKKEFIAE